MLLTFFSSSHFFHLYSVLFLAENVSVSYDHRLVVGDKSTPDHHQQNHRRRKQHIGHHPQRQQDYHHHHHHHHHHQTTTTTTTTDKVSVRWAAGKRSTNRLPNKGQTLPPLQHSGVLGLRMGPYVPIPQFLTLGTQEECLLRFLT